MSFFLFVDSILGVDIFRAIVPGEFPPGLNWPDDIFFVEGIFPWRWGQLSWCYLKTISN